MSSFFDLMSSFFDLGPAAESGGGVVPAGGGAGFGGLVDDFASGGAPGFGGAAAAGGAPGDGFPAPEGIAVLAIPDFSPPIFDLAVTASSSVLDFVAAVKADLLFPVFDFVPASAPGSRGLSAAFSTDGLSFSSFVLLKMF
ncbi:hypothetical protein ACQ4LE_000696 [Meloidogyne hapla]